MNGIESISEMENTCADDMTRSLLLFRESSPCWDEETFLLAGKAPHLLHELTAKGLLRKAGGGYVLAGGGKILGALPLRVGGLMSTAPWEEIQAGAGAILERAKAMGIPYHVDPFTSLSFLALPVIPELRLTDRGLFDVTAFSLVKD